MPKKKRVTKAQAGQSEKVIRYSALAVILVVIAFFAWKFLPKTDSARGLAKGPACAVFNSIKAADQYDSPPPLLIDTAADYFATIQLEKGGSIVIQLYPDKAPVTVNSFIFLSCKGFFDGVTFHRVLEGFMAQSGDPTGLGSGSPGYSFDNEDSDLLFDKEGVVAMANSGRDTNGSQFFITFEATPSLNGNYTIFGQVIEGMDSVKSITLRDPQQNPTFRGDVIKTVMVTQK